MVATAAVRAFQDLPATRERTPLLIGEVGPSGGGKTYSALRLATGIQRVTGGDIGFIDTEARRALHYADNFKFRHMEFKAPFGPLDYLAAIEHFVKRGIKIIIVDSMSHEHEGPGGVLETHEAEQERLVNLWKSSHDKVNMAAWQKPKSERRKLINTILQMPVNFIFCFRAKEKIKMDKSGKPIPMGWMPIAGEEFIYEMTINMLLGPNAGGIPSWHPEELGEKAMIKIPGQFREIFAAKQPLSEEIGEKLALWATGSKVPAVPQETAKTPLQAAEQGAEAVSPHPAAPIESKSISEPQRKRLFAISSQAGWSEREVKDLIGTNRWPSGSTYESTKDISKVDYAAICTVLEQGDVTGANKVLNQDGESNDFI